MDCGPPGSSCPCYFPGKNTGVVCHFLLQGIFLTQGLNLCQLHWQVDSLLLSHQGSLIGSVNHHEQKFFFFLCFCLRMKDLLPAASKKNTEDLSQCSVFMNRMLIETRILKVLLVRAQMEMRNILLETLGKGIS